MLLVYRIIFLILFGVITAGCYLGSQSFINAYIPISSFELKLPGEEGIPFLPVFILVYVSIYFMPMVLFLNMGRLGRLYKAFMSFMLATVIHLIFFLLLPMEYRMRPEVEIPSEALQALFRLLHTIDRPTNTFPSMHVSFAFLCYFITRRYFPRQERAVLILAVAVGFSTVLVKQHYILDAVAGALMAVAINKFYISRSFVKSHDGNLVDVP